jgi:hypothetical protein
MEHEVYCLTVKGHLGGERSEWFDGLTIIRVTNGETKLIGPVAAQAALHGALSSYG